MNTANSNTQTVATFYKTNQPSWSTATISTGTYGCKDYRSKEYKTKSGLMKAMIALGYSTDKPYSGETWNSSNKQYKVTFDYN
jgi:hypothetical protein